MAAIEYGSYYWCVVLIKADKPDEAVYLHADSLSVDANGALTFRSAGRRPAGTDPKAHQTKQHEDEGEEKDKSHKNGDNKRGDSENEDKQSSMIYVAFGPGTWKMVYAAKLKDGSAASVEHWDSGNRKSLGAVFPSHTEDSQASVPEPSPIEARQ